MNNQNRKKIEEVKKPTMIGSFHGKDANKLALKRFAAMFVILLVYFVTAFLFSFDILWIRVICSFVVVAMVCLFTYSQGASQGESDAGYGEIMYARQQEGKQISKEEHDRCFHPLKGFYAVVLGTLPFVLIAIYFAYKTTLTSYTLGGLPSWTSSLLEQNETGDALAYYSANQQGMQFFDYLRIFVRGLIMPFVNVAVSIGREAVLSVERLSPVLLLIAPMGYAVGYTQGIKMRIRVNTSIKLGVEKKKRREKRERKQRQRNSRQPEQLI